MNLRDYAAKQENATEGKKEASAGILKAPAKPPALQEKYRRIYRAVFDLHARHTPAPQTMEEWQDFALDCTTTANAANNDPFALDLIIAITSELERESKATANPTESTVNNF